MNKRHLFYSLPMILLLIVAVAGWFATDYLGNHARQEIVGESRASVLTLSLHVSDTLSNVEGAVKSLAGSPWIAPVLLSKEELDIEHANSALDRYNSAINASVTYLMDADGMTVASSNRKDPDSFVGKSYSFRPYFQAAVKGQAGRYFGLGMTSGKRGFYASYPVQDRLGKLLGVVAMKKDLDVMETFFSQYPFCFLTSPEGVIFLSSKPAMVLKSLWPPDKTAQEKLMASQQFGNRLSEVVFTKKEITDATEVTLEGRDYFVSRKILDSDGWSIVVLTPTDRIRNYKLISILLTIGACSLIIFFSVIIYITEKSRAAIRQSEEKFRSLFNNVEVGIFRSKLDGSETLDVNEKFLDIVGMTLEETLEMPSVNLWVDPKEREEMVKRLIADGSVSAFEYKMLNKRQGEVRNCLTSLRLYRESGIVEGSILDITKRKRAEEELRNSEGRLQTLLQTIPDIIWLKDKDGVYLSCNTMFERFFGAKEADIVGKTDYDFVDRELADVFREHDNEAMAAGKPISKEDWITFADDGHRALMDTIKTPMHDSQGTLIGVLGIGRDITERRRYEEQLEHLAIHDQLTGLLNRHSLEDILSRTIAKAKRGAVSSILYMDLDNFKEVNDSIGHGAGDEVLITLAGLLKDAVRIEDIVFRLGGDEFAVLLDGMSSISSLSAAERLLAIVEAHRFELEGRLFPLSLSIGLIEIDGTLATGELLSQADAAMYRAKAQGKNRVVVA